MSSVWALATTGSTDLLLLWQMSKVPLHACDPKDERTVHQAASITSAVLQVRAELRRRTAAHAPGSAGLLRALGVAVPPNPGAGDLAAAARRALREHHPDRHHAAGLRAQLVAEETFKLIAQAVPV